MSLSMPAILRTDRRGYFPGAKAVIRSRQNTASRRYDAGVIEEQLNDLFVEKEEVKLEEALQDEKMNTWLDDYEDDYFKWVEEEENKDNWNDDLDYDDMWM